MGLSSILNFLPSSGFLFLSDNIQQHSPNLIDVTANPDLQSTKPSESIQRGIACLSSIAIRIDYDVIARDKVIFSTLVKSRAAVMISKAQLTREKEI